MRNKILWLSAAAAAALLSVLPFALAGDEGPVPDSSKIQAWIQDLGSDSLEVREQAWRKLKSLGEDARDELLKARDHEDVDVRFSVRRLLEALPADEDARAARDEDPFGNLRRRRAAPPRPLFPRRPGAWNFDDVEEELRRFQEDMDAWQRDLDRWMDELLQSQGVDPGAKGLPADQYSESSATSVQIGPDGHVRVEIKRNENGQEVEKVYEAESIEAFREQYPEVAKEIGLGGTGAWSFRLQLPRAGQAFPFATPFARIPARSDDEGPRLGVMVQTLSEENPLDEDGQVIERGLLVSQVLPRTLASRLGVRVGDVIVKVGDKEVSTPEDVREALLARDETEGVQVTVIRRGEEKVLKEVLRG